MSKICLNLGSGVAMLRDFINVDAFFTEAQIREGARTKKGFCMNAKVEPNSSFVQANIIELDKAFDENFADYVLMDNVIEHMPIALVTTALQQVYRVMKFGGRLVILAPDFNGLARVWADNIATKVGTFKDFDFYHFMAETVYGNQIGAGEYHRVPITPDYLNYQLRLVGFEQKHIKMSLYPMNGPGPKGLFGVVFDKRGKMRSDLIVADIRKTKEKKCK